MHYTSKMLKFKYLVSLNNPHNISQITMYNPHLIVTTVTYQQETEVRCLFIGNIQPSQYTTYVTPHKGVWSSWYIAGVSGVARGTESVSEWKSPTIFPMRNEALQRSFLCSAVWKMLKYALFMCLCSSSQGASLKGAEHKGMCLQFSQHLQNIFKCGTVC